jgi:hypothetical protein
VAAEVPKTVPQVIHEPSVNYGNKHDNGKPKLGSLEALRQKLKKKTARMKKLWIILLELDKLKNAWHVFIDQLKENKNPAWTSFELAELKIKDAKYFRGYCQQQFHQKVFGVRAK